jgi:hypothetical protein
MIADCGMAIAELETTVKCRLTNVGVEKNNLKIRTRWQVPHGRDPRVFSGCLLPLRRGFSTTVISRGERRPNVGFSTVPFTPCTAGASLLEAEPEAAENAVPSDVVLLSPACSSFDLFQNRLFKSNRICSRVKSISRGELLANPHMSGRLPQSLSVEVISAEENEIFRPVVFEGKLRSETTHTIPQKSAASAVKTNE